MSSAPDQEPQASRPHVCVIGAGVCGLVSTKICLENGLRVSCFDKSSKYGGLWNYRPDDADPEGPFEPSVMRTTILNTSKELSAFSDFPPPAQVANFMRHNHYMDYIHSYVRHFQLLPHLRLEHEILRCEPHWTLASGLDQQHQPNQSNGSNKDVRQTADGNKSASQISWSVTVKNLRTNEVRTETYDKLMVAVGHHNIPFAPTYPNQANFKGTILHSARLKNILASNRFVDKNVLVIGFGNSACDAANDIALVANKCYVSCHRGQWFTSRYLAEGPYDFRIKSRIYNYLTRGLPGALVDRAILKRIQSRTNHKLLGLEPKHKPSEQVPAINDLFPFRIYTGGITLKGAVHHFTESGAVFEGEEGVEYGVDIVVLATGYEAKISFLDELGLGLRSAEHNNDYELFLNIFAPNFCVPKAEPKANGFQSNCALPSGATNSRPAHADDNNQTLCKTVAVAPGDSRDAIKSIAFIGLVQPNGSLTVISELQARYAALVFRGERELPSMKAMSKSMDAFRRMRAKAIRSHSRDQLIGSYVGYTEKLARLIGAKPNLAKLFFTDPKLWRELMFGPCTSYQYRLTGPGCWPEARTTVLSTKERVYCGINEGKNHILYKTRHKCLDESVNKSARRKQTTSLA